jgi:hypothetical protein
MIIVKNRLAAFDLFSWSVSSNIFPPRKLSVGLRADLACCGVHFKAPILISRQKNCQDISVCIPVIFKHFGAVHPFSAPLPFMQATALISAPCRGTTTPRWETLSLWRNRCL